ncbi:Methyltransferase type [Melia azedarach]|uniref:Methyltransferase type n=2 Tax=Melia azedarach TaxID=155640 RepID=A0ACC1X1I0_MELAZ|nr:Methyltransferase type [Melia azedarach]KAJ4704879.1 Methyltransferase type [Melia azedarach]
MDLKSLKFKILNGSIARRVLLRCFMAALAFSIIPLLQILSGSDPITFNTVASNGCGVISGYSNPYMFLDRFIYPIVGSLESVQCKENANLTINVVKELMGLKMLSNDAHALCVGEGSASSVYALREVGFDNVCGVYRHPFFSLKHRKFVYKLDYEDNSFDFVFSRDLDKVSVPAVLVLEIERVLKPGGVGAMLVGVSSSSPNSLIRSAAPVSSILKTSSIVHVDHVNGFTLVVFKKKIEAASYFEQFHLPADCQSLRNNEPFMQFLEPLVEEKPIGFEKNIVYLPKFMDVASKKRLVYIDVGAGEHLNSSVKSWFLPSYPVDHRAFNVYFVDHNTSVMLSYVKRPGITFVYHPDLAGRNDKANPEVFEDLDPYAGDEGFDFHLWFKETVRYADFVVLKMNAGEVELRFLMELFKSGTICFVDELFLRCLDRADAKDAVSGSCMDLFKSLRNSGVFVHQWWED